jgi:hypothetical protein
MPARALSRMLSRFLWGTQASNEASAALGVGAGSAPISGERRADTFTPRRVANPFSRPSVALASVATPVSSITKTVQAQFAASHTASSPHSARSATFTRSRVASSLKVAAGQLTARSSGSTSAAASSLTSRSIDTATLTARTAILLQLLTLKLSLQVCVSQPCLLMVKLWL